MRHLESNLQKNCVKWFRMQYNGIGRLLFSVPNGGARNAREAGILKGEGVTAGVSDLILLYRNNNYGALCIEFKTITGRQTQSQKQWQKLAEENGCKYVVCRSFDDFREEIESYLFNKIS